MKISEVKPETITAAGNACIGLGQAIKGLAGAGMTGEAQTLVEQLIAMCKAIRWLAREDRGDFQGPEDGDESITHAERFITELLGERGTAPAGKVIAAAMDAGHTKSAIFGAVEALGLLKSKRGQAVIWTMPAEVEANGAASN